MEEIREMLKKMEVATARGRAEVNHRAICLEPNGMNVEMASKARIDIYISIAKRIAEEIRECRDGISAEEVERVEFIREQLLDLAKSVSTEMIDRAVAR